MQEANKRRKGRRRGEEEEEEVAGGGGKEGRRRVAQTVLYSKRVPQPQEGWEPPQSMQPPMQFTLCSTGPRDHRQRTATEANAQY